MRIQQGLLLIPGPGAGDGKAVNSAIKETTDSFGATLGQAIKDVNNLQNEAGKAVEQMVTGEATDLHQVMIAAEKAKTSFDLLMEVRNKAIDTYRELMRLQV
jgi:flagellar hook-basal body complex protein FliE